MRGAVTAFVHEMRQHLLDTELRIMVGMAEGADLLVAQTVLELGLGVDAVLPMPLDKYAADFDAETLELLHTLLRRPDVVCVELPLPAQLDDAAAIGTPAHRNALYANLTDALIRRSSLLLTLWDGQSSPLPGGTADTVLRYLGVRTDENVHEDRIVFVDAPADFHSASRLVYWIPAARSGAPPAPDVRLPCFLLGVGDNVVQRRESMPAQLQWQLTGLNRFNLEFAQLTVAGSLHAPDSLLATLPVGAPLHDRPTLEEIDAQYGKADALAVYYQKRSDRLFALFGVMALTMGLAYLIYEKLTESRLVLIVYLVILLSSLGVYYVLQGRRWFAKHLTYRVLAETMRAKFYLRLAGADHLVDAGAVLSLSGIDQFHGFSWISCVLKSVKPPELRPRTSPGPDSRQSRFVEQAWIENQHRYFTSKVARLEKSSRRIKRLRNSLFVVILLVILVLFLFGEYLQDTDLGLGVPLKNIITFCMGFLAVVLAVWELHQDKMATRELLWQYRNQQGHFSRAKMQLAHITALSRRQDVLAELGKDSLMESYLWTIHRYHREHEPPTGA